MKGIADFNITNTALGINFTPSTHCVVKKKIGKNDDIERTSKADTNKIFKVGYHVVNEITIDDETENTYLELATLQGEEVVFTPHTDNANTYNAIVLEVIPIAPDEYNNAYKIILTLESTDYESIV